MPIAYPSARFSRLDILNIKINDSHAVTNSPTRLRLLNIDEKSVSDAYNSTVTSTTVVLVYDDNLQHKF
jgi:hypothetical protein